MKRVAGTVLFAFLLGATAAHAVPTTYEILLDLDNLASTGCTVTGTWGSFAGVEERLIVAMNTTGPATAIVDQIDRQVCTTPLPLPGTFGPLSLVDPGDWPVGIGNGTLGQNVIEAYYPLPTPNPPFVRYAVVARDAAGAEDAILTTSPTSGLPLVIQLASVVEIPTLSGLGFLGLGILLSFMAVVLLRRRVRGVAIAVALLALGSAAWGITCVLDGQTTEWAGIPPSGTDTQGDGTPGSEVVAVFAAEDEAQNEICFRIDGSLQFNAAPVALADGPSVALTTNEDTLLGVAAPGVLGNDTDADGPPPLEAVLVTGPSNAASFALNLDGSFNYTPALDFNGSDSFTYQARDGFSALSSVVTVSLTVTAVNDTPSFTKGADESVLQGAGAQTVNPWATAISPGPADEAAQTLTFNVTGNTNAALFSVAPAVSPAGVLTYTPAPGQVGSATITLTLQDNGGTANGGVDTSPAQTFVISVVDVNDAPSFTKGADQTVLEDAGAQTVNPWATAISPGPPSESGQTVSFNITGNTNSGLFSAGPAVSPAGVLTYTPAADANGSATITLNIQDNGGTANGGVDTSAAQTFVINVTAVNDAPSFTKGADPTVNEDAGAQTVNPWATAISPGPADESAQTLTFNVTGNTNATLFSVAPAISPTGVLTYTPAANTAGTATITLTLSDNGGTANGGADTSAAQTFVITVAGINDAPSFTKGADQTVNEDAGAQAVNPWATTISAGPPDESGQTVTFNITGNTNPGLFSAGPAVSPTGVLTYTPAANSSGTATITLNIQDDGGTANGGVDTSAGQTFVITVNAVNDAPSFTKGADQTVNEDAGAQTVNPWATAISAGPADESGQTLTFNVTGNTTPGLFSAGPAVSPTGVLTYTPVANAAGAATITLNIQDNGGTANGGVDTSAAQTFVITVNAVNDAPSFTKGADPTVNEDAGAQTVNPWATAISPGPADESAQTVSFNITGNTNPGLFSAGPAVSSTGVLTYTPAANEFGTTTITLNVQDNGGTANGGVDTSAAQTFVITVNSVNDVPSFTKGADPTVNEDAGAQTVNPWATAISAGPANESGQTLSFNITGNTNPGLFAAGPAVSSAGVLTYTPAANTAGAATITLNVQDNGGTANGGVDTSAGQTFVITVNGINDPPSFTKGPDPTVDEDAGPQTANPWATAISPGPPDESGQTVSFQITGNTNSGLFSAGPAVSATGVLTYTPATNAFGTATITLVLQDNGGTANGGVDTSASQSFVITVNPVNDPPVADDETLDTIGNTELRYDLAAVSSPHVLATTPVSPPELGVLDGDSDPVEGNSVSILNVVGCGDLTAPFGDSPACATANGGTVTLNADGSFTLTPKDGDTLASDSFQYTLTDSQPVNATDVGLVTINRQARVWYVQNDSAAGGLGRSTDPFDTLFEAETASVAGDTIYVFNGDNATTGQANGIVLKNNQRLVGEGAQLTVPVAVNGGPNPTALRAAGAHALLDDVDAGGIGVAATDVIPIEIIGLSLAGAVNAIDLTTTAPFAGTGSTEIRDNIIRSAGAEGIDVNHAGTAAFNLSVHDNNVTATGDGIDVNKSGTGSTTITAFDDNAVSGATGGIGIEIVNAIFDQTPGNPINQVAGGVTTIGQSGNGVGTSGMVLTNVTGDLGFTDMDIFNDAGTSLGVTSTGVLNAVAGTGFRIAVASGVAMIDSNAGPAVSINNASVSLPLNSLESTNSTTTGVSLVNAFGGLGNTALSVSSGLISDPGGASGAAVNISGGNGNITLAIPITNTSGNSVVVTGRTGDTVSFSGAINETGSGISLTTNTGATINFSGGITASTGTNAAFTATGGATALNITGTNTLATTTGTALNVANTTIGASNLMFRSISTNGAANGIVLNTTGASGSLIVGGNGGACSSAGTCTGGAIQNATSHGISLTSTLGPSFTRMAIVNTSGSGINGTTVTNFTLADSFIDNSGTGGGADDSNLAFDVQAAGTETNLSGVVTITNNTLTNARWHGVRILNFNGTLSNLVITGNTITSSTSVAASLGSGIHVQILGSASTVSHLTRANIANNTITNFPSDGGIEVKGGNSNAAGAGGTMGTPGSATDIVAITGNLIAGQSAANRMGTMFIDIGISGGNSASRSQANFDISNNGTVANPLQHSAGIGIGLGNTGYATSTVTMNNNRIVANNTVASAGIGGGNGLVLSSAETPDLTWTIQNNDISQTDGNGILAVARAINGIMKAKIQNNTVAAPLSGVRPGIRIDAGNNTPGEDAAVCLNLSGNTSAGSGGTQGLGLRKQGIVTTTNDFGIHGLPGGSTATPNLEVYVNSQNPAGGGTLLISATSGFSTCSLP